jgi:uncharacterized protein (DUF342 family)
MAIEGLVLREDDKHQLVAAHALGGVTSAVTTEQVTAAIRDAGFGDLALDLKAIEACARDLSRDAPFEIVIGRRSDASYQTLIAPDRMAAFLTVLPAMGGKSASLEAAKAALAGDKIVFGIRDASILEAIGPLAGQRVEVAAGTPPKPGKDAWLEPLVEVNAQRHPKIGDDGHVDFRDLGGFPSVAPGTSVMRRHPPEKGIPGRNVLGENVATGDGKDLQFAVRLQGVEPDPADRNVLRATAAGQPILQRDGVTIEAVMKLDRVDLSTGNVDILGSIEIKGDVQSGMRVKASGDITVVGTVESAEIIAGGDVIARGGIVGHDAQGAPDSKKENTARIHAHGNVKARHIENAIVMAEQSVYVDETLVACDVMAIDQVVVGTEKGNSKGHIMGGFVRATTRVKADEVGAPGASQTRIFVGANPLLQKALDHEKERLAAKLKEHGELTKVAKILAPRPDRKEIFEKAKATIRKTSEEIAEIMDEEKRLSAELKLADHAEIVVVRKLHSGCMLAIGKKSKFIGDDHGPTTFHLSNGEIVGS